MDRRPRTFCSRPKRLCRELITTSGWAIFIASRGDPAKACAAWEEALKSDPIATMCG